MATATATADSPFDRLSVGLLQQVLQGVPQRERLTQCSLVSRAWAEAVALATQDVTCTALRDSHAVGFAGWLSQNAGRLRRLVVGHSGGTLSLLLPWALLTQLQALSLSHIELPAIQQQQSRPRTSRGRRRNRAGTARTTRTSAAAAATAAAPPPAAAIAPLLPQLKELKLDSCVLHSSCCLQQLTNSPQLTSLKVYSYERYRSMGDGSWEDLSPAVKQQLSTELCFMLRGMQQLVVLELHGQPMGCAVFLVVAAMQQLQELELAVTDDSAATSAAVDLPTSLTRLVFTTTPQLKALLPASQLQRLSGSLRCLQLCVCEVQPSIIRSMTQLQVFGLVRCTLLPDHQQGGVALLQALGQLTGLHSLRLHNAHLQEVEHDAQLFSALTASSQLVDLYLGEDDEQPLPQGALQRALAGKELPQLQELSIVNKVEYAQGQEWCVSNDDLAAIVSACPALMELALSAVVERCADFSELQLLPDTCRSLTIGGDQGDDAAAVVAQLSQLTKLSWDHDWMLGDLGVEQLTAVRGLASLCISVCPNVSRHIYQGLDGSDAEWDEEDEHERSLTLATDTIKGPVWQQLEEVCGNSPACVRVRLQRENKREDARNASLLSEVARLQLEVQQLQQQLADRDAQLAARNAQPQLQQELAELRV